MYKSALCHLHSLFEGNSSAMSGFCYEAQRYGVDVVWISDHDSRYFRDSSYQLDFNDDYDFGALNGPDSCTIRQTDGTLQVKTASSGEEWRGVTLNLPFLEKPQKPPLISRPTFYLKFSTDIQKQEENRRLFFRFHLSQIPPDHQPLVIDYYLGSDPGGENSLPLSGDREGEVIRLTEDVQKLGFNSDHNLNRIELGIQTRKGAAAECKLEKISFETELSTAEDLLAAQKKLAENLSEEYGIKVLVNCEVSSQNGHMTAFGKDIPIPRMDKRKLTGKEVSRYLAQWGGVASLNHPFSSWKREELSQEDKEELISRRVEEYTENELYGARMLEVAFPEGRHNFTAAEYIRLWDRLNLNGLRVVAIGVSDAHGNRSWDTGNNFANYMRSPDCRVENLVAAMKKGDLYTADPIRVKGQLNFETDQGKTMGDTQNDGEVSFDIQDIPRGSKLAWVVDGEYVKEEVTTDSHKSNFPLKTAEHFVRAELRDTYGRLLLLTNPIWTR